MIDHTCGDDTAVQRVARRVSEHAAKTATSAPLVVPSADEVNHGAAVSVPARLLPPKLDDHAEQRWQPQSAQDIRTLETAWARSQESSIQRGGAVQHEDSTSQPSARLRRRERYYRKDVEPTDHMLKQALAHTSKSPKPFQRRHLKGIPDAFRDDSRHKALLEQIATDIAFTTQKHRLEAVLKQRAEFAVRNKNKLVKPAEASEGCDATGSSSLFILPASARDSADKRAARRIESRPVDEWNLVATARCVNGQSRYILQSSMAREKAMRELLECETCTTLDDLQYLRRQLELVESQS